MSASSARRAAELEVSRGGVPDRLYPLVGGTIRIGRAHDNDLVLEDATKGVSRYHAEIRHEADGFVLVDLESQNGTWVGTERVQRVILTPGTDVAIGPYRLVLLDPSTHSLDLQTIVANSPGSSVHDESRPTPTTDPSRVHGPSGPGAPPPAARSTAAASGTRMWLWATAGGTVVILALLATVYVVAGGAVATPAAPACRCGPAADVERRIQTAGAAFARGETGDTLRNEVLALRAWRPADTGLSALLADVDDRAMPASPAPTVGLPPPPPPEPSKPRVDAATGLKQNPGERSAAFQQRVREANDAFHAVMEAVGRADLAAATAALPVLEQRAPDHPKLSQVRRSVQQVVDAHEASIAAVLSDARRLESSGQLAAARQKLLEANSRKAGAATADLARLTARMTQLGEDAYKKGRAAEAFGDRVQAKEYYQRAVDLLPPDHKDVGTCQARLRALG
jgi:pSer/pThr/pTyr-binding forkhead associated (FHA) protein